MLELIQAKTISYMYIPSDENAKAIVDLVVGGSKARVLAYCFKLVKCTDSFASRTIDFTALWVHVLIAAANRVLTNNTENCVFLQMSSLDVIRYQKMERQNTEWHLLYYSKKN
jgi:hypothetical protein